MPGMTGEKLFWFLGWLAIAFIVAPAILQFPQWLAKKGASARSLTVASYLSFIGLAAMPFLHIWFLTGYAFYLPAVALAVGLIGARIAMSVLPRLLFGGPWIEKRRRIRTLLELCEPGAQTVASYQVITQHVFGAIVLLTMVLLYFMYDRQDAAHAMLQLVLYSGPIVTLLIGNTVNLAYLAMPYVDEDTRTTMLAEAVIGLIPMSLQAIIAAYTLHSDMVSEGVNIFGYNVSFVTFAAFVGFGCFILFAIGPYLTGVVLARRARGQLLRRDKRITSETVESLLAAYWKGDVSLIETARGRLASERDRLMQRFPAIVRFEGLRSGLESGAIDAELVDAQVLKEHRRADVRLRVYDRTTHHAEQLGFAARTSQEEYGLGAKRQVLDHIILELTHRIRVISDEIVRAHEARPGLFTVIAVVASFVGSLALSSVGKLLFEYVVRSVQS
jgi:hypothetical protein